MNTTFLPCSPCNSLFNNYAIFNVHDGTPTALSLARRRAGAGVRPTSTNNPRDLTASGVARRESDFGGANHIARPCSTR